MFVKLAKQTWLFRKVEKIKDLYFEKLLDIIGKLDATSGKLDAASGKLDAASANDTSVLQTLVYLVEAAQEAQRQQNDVQRRLASIERTLEKARESLDTLSGRLDERREREVLRLDAGVRESLGAFSRGHEERLEPAGRHHADAATK